MFVTILHGGNRSQLPRFFFFFFPPNLSVFLYSVEAVLKNVYFLVHSLCHFRGSSFSCSKVLLLSLLNFYSFPARGVFSSLVSNLRRQVTGNIFFFFLTSLSPSSPKLLHFLANLGTPNAEWWEYAPCFSSKSEISSINLYMRVWPHCLQFANRLNFLISVEMEFFFFFFFNEPWLSAISWAPYLSLQPRCSVEGYGGNKP